MDDTWRGEETPRLNRTNEILSWECTRIEATWTHRSFDLNLTAVLHRDRSLIGRSRSFIYLSFIGRRRRIMEELRDCGAIEPRSRRDRAAIMEHLAWNHPHRIREWPIKLQDHDCGPIVARSWPDRDPIVASFLKQSQPKKPQIPELRRCQVKPLPWRCKSASTTRSTAHDFGPISLFKNSCTPSLFFNFWSTREEIKRVSRKVLSSRDPLLPRV